METLSAQDVRRFLEFAEETARVARYEPRRLYRWTIEGIARLIPSDAVWQGESDRGVVKPASQSSLLHLRASDWRIETYRNQPDLLAAFSERLVYENPSLAERLRHPFDLRALRLSDFATITRLRRLEAYDVLLRPFGIQRTINVGYRGPRGLNEIICARTHLDFSDRELMLLDLAATATGLAAREPTPPVPPALAKTLTARETKVLEYVARGYSNAEVAGALSVSAGTVKKHLDNIFAKLGVRNRTEAARLWQTAAVRSSD